MADRDRRAAGHRPAHRVLQARGPHRRAGLPEGVPARRPPGRLLRDHPGGRAAGRRPRGDPPPPGPRRVAPADRRDDVARPHAPRRGRARRARHAAEAGRLVRGARGVSLEALIGGWTTEATFPNGVSGTGRTTFEWELGGAFVLQRATADVEGPPEGLMLIGPGADGGLVQHYFDSRGVVRRYAMRVGNGEWTLE